jgi:hypothetical protein
MCLRRGSLFCRGIPQLGYCYQHGHRTHGKQCCRQKILYCCISCFRSELRLAQLLVAGWHSKESPTETPAPPACTLMCTQCPPRPTAEEGESPLYHPYHRGGWGETRRRSLGPCPFIVRNYGPYVFMSAAKHVCVYVRNAHLWHNLSTLSLYHLSAVPKY